jgi:tetratricopeptide (TPR) repeat protein
MVRAAIPLGEYAVAAELAGQVAAGTKSVRERVDALTLLGRAHLEATFSSPEHVAAEEAAGVGRLDRAVEQFEAAIEASAALASEATYWLALARLERGESEMAAAAAASYLQQRPDGPFAEAARSIQAAASDAQDGELAPPTQKSRFRPDYAGKARKQGVCGMVIAQGVVDTDGHYNDVVLLKGIEPVQDERLLEQISRSRFEPATADGTATSTHHRYYLPIRGRGSDPDRQIIPVE